MSKRQWTRIGFIVVVVAVAAYNSWQSDPAPDTGIVTEARTGAGAPTGNPALANAFQARTSDLQVRGSGTVVRVLSDDNHGSRHQRFVLRVNDDQTVLVAHNIDLAPRIPGLREGDVVAFFGEYEWNERGGVIHWTHHDPAGHHTDGWLRHQGQQYD